MKFDGLILDVDGTIWNTTGIVAEAWNKAIDTFFPQVPHVNAEILKGQFGKTMDVIADNLFGVLSADDKKILMKNCCIYEQKALLENTKNITYDGVIASLEKLSKEIPIFIVSNCQSGYIELVIEKNNLQIRGPAIERNVLDLYCNDKKNPTMYFRIYIPVKK